MMKRGTSETGMVRTDAMTSAATLIFAAVVASLSGCADLFGAGEDRELDRSCIDYAADLAGTKPEAAIVGFQGGRFELTASCSFAFSIDRNDGSREQLAGTYRRAGAFLALESDSPYNNRDAHLWAIQRGTTIWLYRSVSTYDYAFAPDPSSIEEPLDLDFYADSRESASFEFPSPPIHMGCNSAGCTDLDQARLTLSTDGDARLDWLEHYYWFCGNNSLCDDRTEARYVKGQYGRQGDILVLLLPSDLVGYDLAFGKIFGESMIFQLSQRRWALVRCDTSCGIDAPPGDL